MNPVMESVRVTLAGKWEGGSVKAECPVCSHERLYVLPPGDDGLPTFECGRGCLWSALRRALLSAGVPDEALRGADAPSAGPERDALPSLEFLMEEAPALLFSGEHPEFLGYLQHLGLSRSQLEARSVGLVRRGAGVWLSLPVWDANWVLRNVRFWDPFSGARWWPYTGNGGKHLLGVELLPDGDDPVLLTEGESDYFAAVGAGVPVVAVLSGAGAVPEDLGWAAGRRVVVCLDNDEPGRRGAQKQARALTEAGALVWVADIGQKVSRDKGDLRDWLTGSGDGEQLQEWVDQLTTESPFDSTEPVDPVRERAEQLVAEGDARRLATVLVAERAGYQVPKFELRTPAEIAVPVEPLEFLVDGLWPVGSHGVIGGAKKSLKSYTADVLALSVATGKPAFGQFPVAEPRPVFLFVGEGGESPRVARLQRLAQDLFGCSLGETDLHLSAFAAPLDSDEFKRAVGRVRETVNPALVLLDSLYCFHPPGVAAGNLYERGPMLFGLSATVGHDVALMVVDHFNKTSSGVDLDRVAQAGMAQWADSWFLLGHRQDPDPAAGAFYLRANVGSRQWGERSYAVDWNVGRFDSQTRVYESPIEVDVREETFGPRERTEHTNERVTACVLSLLDRAPATHTRNEVETYVREETQTGAAKVREVWEGLVADGLVVGERLPHVEGTRTVTRELWSRAKTSGRVMVLGGEK